MSFWSVRFARLTTLLLAGVVGGCGAAGPPQMRRPDGCSVTAPAPGHALEIYLIAEDAAGERSFCPGQVLHPGDALEIRVELDRSAYVQAIFADPAGEAGILQPQDGDAASDAAVFRAPAGLLTRRSGDAQLFLVASEAPLPHADPALHALFEAIRETGATVDAQGEVHVPRHAAKGSQALHFDTQAALHADFDEDGVAALGLSLRTGR